MTTIDMIINVQFNSESKILEKQIIESFHCKKF